MTWWKIGWSNVMVTFKRMFIFLIKDKKGDKIIYCSQNYDFLFNLPDRKLVCYATYPDGFDFFFFEITHACSLLLKNFFKKASPKWCHKDYLRFCFSISLFCLNPVSIRSFWKICISSISRNFILFGISYIASH